MTKGIIVVNIPNQCDECIAYYVGLGHDICGITERKVDWDEKPDWCPIKPMPEKIDVPDFDDSIKAKNKNAEEVGMYMYDRGHYRGYNICIDKLLGE